MFWDLQKLLGLPPVSEEVVACIMRALHAVHTRQGLHRGKGKRVGPTLPDVILLKFKLERGSKSEKCEIVLSMFPHAQDREVRIANVVTMLSGHRYHAPSWASGSQTNP
jgi:hypothetical protein